ncbi:MAG TPA: NAD(+) synthase [Dehalococcoidia bacterium]|nr:NAD(+) synthase [Dehalococcoidia bacterium]
MKAGQLADRLTLWIAEKVKSAGLKGAVFGMSGGVDSSVVAALSRRACGEDTLGLLMPCHSDPQDEQHALAVAEKFSIRTKKIALDAVYDMLLKSFNVEGDTDDERLARANLKARLRMLTIYFHANRLRYLVTGSGNKSELTVGYFTKYGDGGVDILPLGNLVKTQVRELAAFLGVPQEIIDKPPSAGLWRGQTDEEDLGCSYEELDRLLTGGKASGDIKAKIEKLVAANRHKLNPPPIPDF